MQQLQLQVQVLGENSNGITLTPLAVGERKSTDIGNNGDYAPGAVNAKPEVGRTMACHMPWWVKVIIYNTYLFSSSWSQQAPAGQRASAG